MRSRSRRRAARSGDGQERSGFGWPGTSDGDRRGQGGAGAEEVHRRPDELDPQEQGPPQRRPRPVDQVPGRRAVAAVELDLHRRPEGVVVLDVVALARPLRHGLAQLAVGRVRIVGREPDDRHEVGSSGSSPRRGRRGRGPGRAGSASGATARPPRPGGSGPRGRRRGRCRAPRRRRCSGRGRSSRRGRTPVGARVHRPSR